MEKFYVGRKQGHAGRVVFKSANTPTPEAYPQFASVIGPFRTKRAAILTAVTGGNNPHIQHVRDAERIAKSLA